MLFGKIDYINLAPFHVFLKQNLKSAQLKQSIEYKKSYPSDLNRKFKRRHIDAAFISSIESRRGNFRCLSAGIVAKKEIQSVLVKKGGYKEDSHSATSNALAKVLGIDGEVIIGDKALKLYCEDHELYIDLAKEWYKKTKTPFVFARFCMVRNCKFYRSLIQKFLKTNVKVPQYVLHGYTKRSGVKCKDIKAYLKLVSYTIDTKSAKSLKLFLKESR
ncbi:MAG TPA: menaquinone via futalosine step 1 [Campylobacterales bacterium]|nr:menaquinone via futalosine step 1 [Campylobacterales bacterium]HIP59432.1 menaquinone via futalosine step 1 [Campylobacterales bacterium]